MTDGTEKRYYPHDLLRLAFRHRGLLMLSAIVFANATLVAVHFMPLKYTGKSIFEFGLEAAAEQISRTSKESFGAIKERLRHDLAGYNAMEKAVTELGLLKGLPHDEKGQLTFQGRLAVQQLIGKCMEDLEVKWEARSNQEDLVSVNFTHEEPVLAEQMPNLLVAAYIERTYERIRDGLKRQHEFLQGKVADCDRVMAELTRRRIKIETEHAGLLPENVAALEDKVSRTRGEIDSMRREQGIGEYRLSRLKAARDGRGGGANQPSQIIKHANPELAALRDQLRRLRDELDLALWKEMKTDKHPAVAALRAKIAQTEQQIEQTPPEVVKETVFTNLTNPADLQLAIATTESELASRAGEVSRLEGMLATYEGLLSNFSAHRQGYLEFMKEWEDRKKEAEHWRARMEEVEVALAAAVNHRLTHLRAIQPAHEQLFPSSPSVAQVLGMSLGGAAAFTGLMLFLMTFLDRSITTTEDAAKYFDVPIQGVISEIVTMRSRLARRIKHWLLMPVLSLVILGGTGLSVMSIVLRLNDPRKYTHWRTSPAEFVQQEVYRPAESFLKNL